MKRAACFCAVLLGLLVSGHAGAAVSDARVIAVIDGDTLLMKPLNRPRSQSRFYKLRLADIDAPEHDQAFGLRAKRELEKLVLDRPARVRLVATDQYGRKVGWLSVDQSDTRLDINAELVRRGAAWALTRYGSDRLRSIQRDAQRSGQGLWAAPSPMAPWVWRRQQRAGSDPVSQPARPFASTPPRFPPRD